MFNTQLNSSISASKYTRRYTPNHSFACILIRQIECLKLRSQDVVKAMGYPKQNTLQACDRLRHVLGNKTLGLDGSYLDANYEAEEFLITLCDLLQIAPEQYQQAITDIKHDLPQETTATKALNYGLRADIEYKCHDAKRLSKDTALQLAKVHLPKALDELDSTERHEQIHHCI